MQMSETSDATDAEVYRAHGPDLVRFATVLVGPDDAQDVVAGAFLRCLSSRRWRDVTDHRAYLFRAVANEAKNLRRAIARRRSREDRVVRQAVFEMTVPRPEIRAAVEGLSVRQRAVVYLAYWEDMTDGMIAEHLGISAGTVRRHLARARRRLREVLDE